MNIEKCIYEYDFNISNLKMDTVVHPANKRWLDNESVLLIIRQASQKKSSLLMITGINNHLWSLFIVLLFLSKKKSLFIVLLLIDIDDVYDQL